MSKLPRAKKKLGQHFLKDEKVIKGITEDWAQDCDVIIEVGPGPAVLTKHLASIGKPFFVLEKDESFKPYLSKILKDEQIIFGDALKFHWEEFIKNNNLEKNKIWLVSNLPYNVGTILYTQFLQIENIEYLTLMFQKEVGDKTYPREGTNLMNGLLFLSTNYLEAKLLLKVSPGCFTPPPKVDSVVVSYQRKENPEISIDDYKEANSFTRTLFGNRRKQIGSVLKQVYDKELISQAFETAGVVTTARAESLSYVDVMALFQAIRK